jgi:hypothetical protein
MTHETVEKEASGVSDIGMVDTGVMASVATRVFEGEAIKAGRTLLKEEYCDVEHEKERKVNEPKSLKTEGGDALSDAKSFDGEKG